MKKAFLSLLVFVVACPVKARFATFPEIKNISLVRNEGRWSRGGGEYYLTHVYTAKKSAKEVLEDGSQFNCEFSFETALPDVQMVLKPQSKNWKQVKWTEVSRRNNLGDPHEYDISYRTEDLFSMTEKSKVTWDTQLKETINPSCLSGHWNLPEDQCDNHDDYADDPNCVWTCDIYANEPVHYEIHRSINTELKDPTSPSGTTPSIHLSCLLSTLNPAVFEMTDNQVLGLLKKF